MIAVFAQKADMRGPLSDAHAIMEAIRTAATGSITLTGIDTSDQIAWIDIASANQPNRPMAAIQIVGLSHHERFVDDPSELAGMIADVIEAAFTANATRDAEKSASLRMAAIAAVNDMTDFAKLAEARYVSDEHMPESAGVYRRPPTPWSTASVGSTWLDGFMQRRVEMLIGDDARIVSSIIETCVEITTGPNDKRAPLQCSMRPFTTLDRRTIHDPMSRLRAEATLGHLLPTRK